MTDFNETEDFPAKLVLTQPDEATQRAVAKVRAVCEHNDRVMDGMAKGYKSVVLSAEESASLDVFINTLIASEKDYANLGEVLIDGHKRSRVLANEIREHHERRYSGTVKALMWALLIMVAAIVAVPFAYKHGLSNGEALGRAKSVSDLGRQALACRAIPTVSYDMHCGPLIDAYTAMTKPSDR